MVEICCFDDDDSDGDDDDDDECVCLPDDDEGDGDDDDLDFDIEGQHPVGHSECERSFRCDVLAFHFRLAKQD